ncbi:MAG: hypothetical protein J6V95_01095 [Bacteroidaceae bacterium]|nr:hypothetical protein [Bacteroidaceae bacterium]
MRRPPILLTVILTCLMLGATSCRQQDEEDVPPVISGFFTAHSGSDGIIDFLTDDFGKEYDITVKEYLTPNNTGRVVCTLELDHTDPLRKPTGRIRSINYPMSYEAPTNLQLHDSLKVKDPLRIVSSYIGGGHLNVHIEVMVSKEKAYHRVIYCRHLGYSTPTFKIYHNSYGDNPVYSQKAYLSIPLTSCSKNDTITLISQGFDGKYEIKHVYK